MCGWWMCRVSTVRSGWGGGNGPGDVSSRSVWSRCSPSRTIRSRRHGRCSRHGRVGGRSARSATSTPRSPGSPASWARPGTRSGPRSGPCSRRWPTTSPGSPGWPGSASTSMSWHHVSERPTGQGGRGSKYLTGMVDLTPEADGRPRARLLDLVAGRSGKTYRDWLAARGQVFRDGVKEATLDPFHGYKNAIDDQLDDAVAVLDAFHVVKLATTAVDECRRRLQQQIHGHRGRKTDPLYRIRNLLRAGQERLTDRQRDRFHTAFTADERTSKSKSPTTAPNSSARSITRPATPPADGSRYRSSTPSPAARSPKSPASDGPCDSGAASSSATSHRRRQQRRHRSRQRTDRTPPPHRPRLPQPRQLPTTHAPDRRRTHPPPPQKGRARELQLRCVGSMKHTGNKGLAAQPTSLVVWDNT